MPQEIVTWQRLLAKVHRGPHSGGVSLGAKPELISLFTLEALKADKHKVELGCCEDTICGSWRKGKLPAQET